MKKMIIATALVCSAAFASAQVNTSPNPYPRTISVTGSAEKELTPDEIYVNIDLKEYDKKGQGKIALDAIRRDFLSAVRATGIADSLVSIAAYDGNNGNPWWQRKKKKEELYASITYQVKFKNSADMDALVSRLDDNATQNFYIARVDHSKLAQYRKELKIAAIKAAKDKAQWLAEPIGERIGEAVTINEPIEYGGPMIYDQTANVRFKTSAAPEAAGGDPSQPDFRKIKLKYDVAVVFALK
jgi:uncharacterized protein YggE